MAGLFKPRRAGGRTELDVDPATLRWALYARESDDPDGDAAQVTNQIDDLGEFVGEMGATTACAFIENDTSAFKKRRIALPDGTHAFRVVRPVWDTLMTELRRGALNALALPNIDRGMRDPRDLEDLIDLVEQYGVLVLGMSGHIDLTTDAGIGSARTEVNQRNQESRNTSRRVSNGKRRAALKGRNFGGANRPFGWEADKVTVNESEAELIKEAMRRISERVKLATIVNEWNESGVPTVTGKAWTTRTLEQVLTNPRLCGKRTYLGEVLLKPDGTPVRGVWKAILTDVEFASLVEHLTTRNRSNVRDGRGHTTKYLLSPFVRCGRCQARMRGGTRPGPGGQKVHVYWCRAKTDGGCGGCSRLGSKVDKYITELVIQDHERMAFRKIEALPPWDKASELKAVQKQIAETTARYKARKISGGRFFALLEDLEDEERKLVNERDRHEARREAQRTSIADLRAKWDDPTFTLEQRQAAVAESLIAVEIHPTDLGGGPSFDPSKIIPVWRENPSD